MGKYIIFCSNKVDLKTFGEFPVLARAFYVYRWDRGMWCGMLQLVVPKLRYFEGPLF